MPKTKEEGHDILVLNLRSERKKKRHREIVKDYTDGKITWEYCLELLLKNDWKLMKSKTKNA